MPRREFAFIINKSNNERKSTTYSYNSSGRSQNFQYMKILLYIRRVSENAISMRFYVIFQDILNTYSIKQPDQTLF